MHRGKLVSFAQNGEDIVLLRGFGSVCRGLYIDVGAANPVGDSVTKVFYDAGWSGINVEPHPFWAELLRRERPFDVNLELAASDHTGVSALYGARGPAGGAATLERPNGGLDERMTIRTITLTDVCNEYVRTRTIDFLKIDVEGHELKVLQGIDLSRWRPRVILVEVVSDVGRATHEPEVDALLKAAAYDETLFDGVNKFYVDAELVGPLSEQLRIPANVLDNFVPYRTLPALVRWRYIGSMQGMWARARRKGLRREGSANAI